jgi:hypothetical protein
MSRSGDIWNTCNGCKRVAALELEGGKHDDTDTAFVGAPRLTRANLDRISLTVDETRRRGPLWAAG